MDVLSTTSSYPLVTAQCSLSLIEGTLSFGHSSAFSLSLSSLTLKASVSPSRSSLTPTPLISFNLFFCMDLHRSRPQGLRERTDLSLAPHASRDLSPPGKLLQPRFTSLMCTSLLCRSSPSSFLSRQPQ
jgi:hypothetical protein